MKILGLTGGIASGKSAVARELATLGATLLDADAAAHEVINLPSVQALLVEQWGDTILDDSKKTDRKAVAERVFSDEAELQFLEKALHPRIREQFEAKLARLAAEGVAVAVIDAPLLLEAGWGELCDHLLFVDSPREDRLRRAKLRNWSEEEFSKREAFQLPIADKRQQSAHVLTNSGTLESLREQVQALWQLLELDGPDSRTSETKK